MLELPLQPVCRLSGEPLADATLLFGLTSCPLPGVYPPSAEEALPLRTPLRVVQARGSGLVQLAHRLDPAVYARYAFAGGGARGYRGYLEQFTGRVAGRFQPSAAVLEVGCGDGTLLRLLGKRGFADVFGIDPGLPAAAEAKLPLARGFFPHDLPPGRRDRAHDLIVLRHVLEHIESPLAFLAELARRLKPAGELWIEVPDLASTVARGLWSNFYQLHGNYFEAATLDALAATAGLRRVAGEVVDIFGGSLLHRYARGPAGELPAARHWPDIGAAVNAYRDAVLRLAASMPAGTAGYGAAERTAMTFGLCPELAGMIRRLHDGNPHLAGRFLAGTDVPISAKEALSAQPPAGVLIFAVSHWREIAAELRARLPGDTPVGIVGDGFLRARLADLA